MAACCACLAWFTADLLVAQLPRLVLAAFTSIEVSRFVASWTSPRWITQVPPTAPFVLQALHEEVIIISGLLFLAASIVVARRLSGWALVFGTQAVYFGGLRTLSGALILLTSSPLLLQTVLGPGHTPELIFRTVGYALCAAVTVMAAWSLNLHSRRLLAGTTDSLAARFSRWATWLLVPTLLVVMLVEWPYYYSRPPFLSTSFALPAVLLLLGSPALFRAPRSADSQPPGLKGGVAVLVILALAVSGVIGYGRMQSEAARQSNLNEFETHREENLTLHIQKSLLQRGGAQEWIRAESRQLARLAARLGLSLPRPPVEIYFYGSAGLKSAMTRDLRSYTIPANREEIHQLVSDPSDIGDPKGDALLLMRCAWRAPGTRAVAEALARYAAGEFHGQELFRYAGRITREEGAYTLRRAFGLDREYVSPLVADALRGAWVARLVEEHGLAALPLIYREPLVPGREESFAHSLRTSWEDLESRWRAFLAAEGARADGTTELGRRDTAFRRGMTLTEQGRRAGYGSDQSYEQLERLLELGVDSVALVPYGRTRAPDDLAITMRGEGSDDNLFRMVRAAHDRGMHCVIKPQLDAAPGFPGNIRFTDRDRFRAWFSEYRRWLLHYARLAELARAEDLVIGTELSGVTQYESEWRELIREVRGIYTGSITYAAHWGQDLEQVSFWDALDYIGLNMYHPLAGPGELPSADSRRVHDLQQRFSTLARTFGKKIVFTEVGFPDTETAAAMPWTKGDGRVDPGMQGTCYEVVFQAFFNEPWFAGMYWWEWPSHGRYYLYFPTYSPIGKPAAGIVKEWYRQGLRAGEPHASASP